MTSSLDDASSNPSGSQPTAARLSARGASRPSLTLVIMPKSLSCPVIHRFLVLKEVDWRSFTLQVGPSRILRVGVGMLCRRVSGLLRAIVRGALPIGIIPGWFP